MFTICSSAVSYIIDKNIRTAQRLLKQIRIHNGHPKNHEVTLKEFCDYKGFVVEEVEKALRRSKGNAL